MGAILNKTKEEVIEITKIYLSIRKKHHMQIPGRLNKKLQELDELKQIKDEIINIVSDITNHVWDSSTEYILNDIIPYLYGEALD